MARRLTLFIIIGMIAGIALGYVLNISYPKGDTRLADIADYLKLLPEVFLHLIKMIIAPLVFATLVSGIAGMGDSAALGRIGGRVLAWFITASLISIALGLVLVNLFKPGVGLSLADVSTSEKLATADFTIRHFVLAVFPTSVLDAMARVSPRHFDAKAAIEMACCDASARSQGVSVTTLDPALSRAMEPRAPAPARRIAAIRALTGAGVPESFCVISPCITLADEVAWVIRVFISCSSCLTRSCACRAFLAADWSTGGSGVEARNF